MSGDMNSLLQRTLDAHGGLERWRRFEHVSARLRNGGVLWALKRQQGVIDDVKVRVALRREWASHSPFGEPSWQTSFEPHRVAIETKDGRVVEERMTPRESFAGHGLDTPWDRLQLAYFAGYAMWTYLTAPFSFVMDSSSMEITRAAHGQKRPPPKPTPPRSTSDGRPSHTSVVSSENSTSSRCQLQPTFTPAPATTRP